MMIYHDKVVMVSSIIYSRKQSANISIKRYNISPLEAFL